MAIGDWKLSKENYEKMVNLTPELLCICDLDGYYQYANPAFETILGYNNEDLMVINAFSLVHPADLFDLISTLNDISTYQSPNFSFESRYRRKDGVYRWILWNARIQWNERLIYASGHDTTKRKELELELKETTKKLKEVNEFARLGYWEYDAKTGDNYWSDEVFMILGFKPREFNPTFELFTTLVHPDDLDRVNNVLDNHKNHDAFEFDLKLINHHGQIIYTFQRIICDFDKNGDLLQCRGTIQDITERKLAEAKLKESEEKYKSVTHQVPVGIFTYDNTGKVTFVNPRVKEILGSSSDEEVFSINLFTNKSLKDNKITDAYLFCIERGTPQTVETEYTTIWNKQITVRKQITPIKDHNGKVIGGIAIIEDFSERTKMEKELYFAKEQAELSSKAKSQFLANMSHEIRTPMNGIMGMSELLRMTDLSEEQSELLGIVQTSANSLLRIIDDILDISKIDAGKVTIKPELIDVFEFMNHIRNLFKSLADDKGLQFHIHIERNVPSKFITDKIRLIQVISNLIGNGIKFTDQGEVTLRVEMLQLAGNRIELKFSVTDTGIGIHEEDIPRLFTYFTQLDNFLTKRYQGTGLGLAISKSIVESMGGEMSIASEVGKGSTFSFNCFVKSGS